MKHFLTLTAMRIRLTLRNKMFLFFSVIMPFGFFFLYAGVFAKGDPQNVRFFLGPVISLAVMGSFWGLSAALVTFREQGILRRFHVTPVTAADMLASSIVANYVLTLPTVIIEIALRALSSSTSPTSAIFSPSSCSSPSASFPSPPWASSSPASPTPCRRRKSSISSSGSR